MRKTVAIVGRPNVGKSALFNRLAGKNISIVHDMPGVTRDRIMAECRRGPEVFDIMDTGGIGENTSDVLTSQVQTEASIALEVADLLLFVVDVVEGMTPVDNALARQLRKVSKPVVLVGNKADSPRRKMGGAEFTRLGFKDQVDVSAAHGLGIDELVHLISGLLGFEESHKTVKKGKKNLNVDEEDEEEKRKFLKERPLKLAIVGRPNAGKSSLVNALLNEQRAIVSPLAGTTRDSLDIHCTIAGREYQLIDTAGIRKQAKVHDHIEAFSVERAIQSIDRADLCLLMVDSAEGVKAQDRKVAQMILDAHKPCILVMNKWDLFEPKESLADRRKKLNETTRREFFFLHYAPIVSISAAKKTNLDQLVKTIERVRDGAQHRISTGTLNRLLTKAIEHSPGPVGTGADSFKLLYATQINTTSDRAIPVPHFVLFANRAYKLQDSYLRYLESKIREAFPGEGLPFFLKIKSKGKLKTEE